MFYVLIYNLLSIILHPILYEIKMMNSWINYGNRINHTPPRYLFMNMVEYNRISDRIIILKKMEKKNERNKRKPVFIALYHHQNII